MDNIDIESISAEQLAVLKRQAEELVQSLDENNLVAAKNIIQTLGNYDSKSVSLDHESLQGLLSCVHGITKELQVDDSALDENMADESDSVNVSERLNYIVQITQQAANKTMDAIDLGLPMVAGLHDTSETLKAEWAKLKRRELKVGEFNQLSKRLDGFLSETCQQTEEIRDNYNSILVAQEFQDLTGQVVQKVMTVMQTVEDKVSELLQSAQLIEQSTGLQPVISEEEPQNDNSSGEGPQIKAEQRDDVVSGQEDVDDLLSSLGI